MGSEMCIRDSPYIDNKHEKIVNSLGYCRLTIHPEADIEIFIVPLVVEVMDLAI